MSRYKPHTKRCLGQSQPDATCICDDRPLGPSDGEVREQERMRAEIRDLRAQRDELAEALRELLAVALNDEVDSEARRKAQAALAKLEVKP